MDDPQYEKHQGQSQDRSIEVGYEWYKIGSKGAEVVREWTAFVEKQEKELGLATTDKWLKPLKLVHFDARNIYLEAVDTFQLAWFEEHIRPKLQEELFTANHHPIKVHLTVNGTGPTTSSGRKKIQPQHIPTFHLTFDSLDPWATLAHFVDEEGSLATQLLTLSTTSSTFNPLYLHGPKGVGKTHLLMALCHEMRSKNINALYVRSETFTQHVIAAIRCSAMQEFRKAYRGTDVLLIDDVHLFARRAATQEEFFHTFNALHTLGRPIILSSLLAPSQLIEIEPRLMSRFEWGLAVPLKPLSTSGLNSFLERRLKALGFSLSEEVVSYLISMFSSAPLLQQALDTLALRAHMENRSLSLDNVKIMLATLVEQSLTEVLTAEKIISSVASHYGITPADILNRSHAREYAYPRQMAMYLCRSMLKLSLMHIGRIFNRDHSTVMTSIRYIEKRRDTRKDTQEGAHEKETRETLESLSKALKSRVQIV